MVFYLASKIFMKYHLVVFDLAGTTVKDNRDVHRVLQNVLRRHEVAITLEHANAVMGIPKPVAIRDLLGQFYLGPKPITTAWITEIHKHFVFEMRNFYANDHSVGEKNGVRETFQALRAQGIKVAVDTGFDRTITDALLERLGWVKDSLIDCSVTSDEVDRGRPFPDMIFEAMNRTGVIDVNSVIKVGDTVSDIQEGRSAGCGLVIGITSGAFAAEALKGESPHYLIEEIPQLLTFLN
jgi:phosphonatase-like hydrolase